MATVVYQGSQSCLDNSQLVEARMLRLRLSSPKTHFSQSFELATKVTNTIHDHQKASSNRGDSTFFHALYNHSQGASNKETTYVHPLVKRSSSRLSDKSLEMCTERLGSESGSDVAGDISLFLYSSSSSSSSSCFKEDESVVISSGCEMMGSEVSKSRFRSTSSSASKKKSSQLSGYKKESDSRGFPPPLTTMSGSSGSLHVRPHREDGRLIIQAIKSPSTRPCFRAERLNGRLRLSLVEDSHVSSSSSGETRDSIPEDEADDMEFQLEDGNDERFEEEMEICDVDVGAEMGLEDFRRPRRCKQENKRLLNWKPFWVATS